MKAEVSESYKSSTAKGRAVKLMLACAAAHMLGSRGFKHGTHIPFNRVNIRLA